MKPYYDPPVTAQQLSQILTTNNTFDITLRVAIEHLLEAGSEDKFIDLLEGDWFEGFTVDDVEFMFAGFVARQLGDDSIYGYVFVKVAGSAERIEE